jgi:membrane-bound lytic murein transglycosylase D
MNQRRFVLPVLLLFLLSACSHLAADLDQSSDSNDAAASARQPVTEDEKRGSNSLQPPAGSTAAGNGEIKAEIEPETDTSATQKIQTDLDEALELCELSQDYWQQGELENAVDALDRAYALILSVDTSDQPKLIQQKEDLRFMISKRILEIYASRNIVVNGNHNAIPVVVNRHVQAEINLFTQGGERRFFIDSLKRSGRYRDRIASALKDAGLPEELSWLPLIESGFKTHALSRSRALGLWQFIPSTGYKFGLQRNKLIDERMDPAKATRAAIDYLKELHSMFGDWSTVLAAYNCGEGRVLRVIRSQNINYLDNFWDLYERLPRETARYVPRFLATLHILNNLEMYEMDQVVIDRPLEFETVIVHKQVSLGNVAKAIGVEEKALKDLNPELRYKILPGDGYNLRIPPGNAKLLLSQIDDMPVSRPPQRAYVYHRVRHGETLSVIARRYRTSVRSIMRANNMHRSNYIVAGKRLKIPQRGYTQKTVKTIPTPPDGRAVNHIVRKGDSLYIIAKQYGTTTKKIQELNNLNTTTLHIGQVLNIFPGKAQPPPTVDGLATYVVRAGDSPFVIARRYKMPLDRLLYLNQLYPGTKIFPGQKLYIE